MCKQSSRGKRIFVEFTVLLGLQSRHVCCVCKSHASFAGPSMAKHKEKQKREIGVGRPRALPSGIISRIGHVRMEKKIKID